MNKKEDARVKKTKAKLLETFKNMLMENPFEDITVNEICNSADIRRATFYKHFDDKYAFLAYFVGSLREEFDAGLKKRIKPDTTFTYYTEYIRSVVEFLTENEQIVKNVLKSSVLPTLVNVIQKRNYEDTCARLRESVKEGMNLPASVEITAAMMTGAVSSTILFWFESGRQISPEQLVEEICAIFEPMKPKHKNINSFYI